MSNLAIYSSTKKNINEVTNFHYEFSQIIDEKHLS